MKGWGKVYLGGPIRRDENHNILVQDTEWRNFFTSQLSKMGIETFDPCVQSKKLIKQLQKKSNGGELPEPTVMPQEIREEIYKNDLKGLDASYIGVFNLSGFCDGYPTIGSLWELGYLTAQNKAIIAYSRNERLRANPMLQAVTFVDDVPQLFDALMTMNTIFSKMDSWLSQNPMKLH